MDQGNVVKASPGWKKNEHPLLYKFFDLTHGSRNTEWGARALVPSITSEWLKMNGCSVSLILEGIEIH